MKELVRYIHLNPLCGGIVSDYRSLVRYSYCGHGVILGFLKNDWQDTDYRINLFDSSKRPSRRTEIEFWNWLNGMGIKVYRASKGMVRDNIGLFETNTMSEMTVEHACGGHAGECGH